MLVSGRVGRFGESREILRSLYGSHASATSIVAGYMQAQCVFVCDIQDNKRNNALVRCILPLFLYLSLSPRQSAFSQANLLPSRHSLSSLSTCLFVCIGLVYRITYSYITGGSNPRTLFPRSRSPTFHAERGKRARFSWRSPSTFERVPNRVVPVD